MTVFLTVSEVANYLRINQKTVYRMLETGKIPVTRVGHQWRFSKDALDRWLQEGSIKKVCKVLVIDDDEAICELFKDTLLGAGHKVTAVTVSAEGLELSKSQEYDLIFLDLKMPGMDGVEFLKQIRLTKPALPIFVITGYKDSDLMMKALAHGPLGVMGKPFKAADILAAVNSYIGLVC